jgi:phytoene synthase
MSVPTPPGSSAHTARQPTALQGIGRPAARADGSTFAPAMRLLPADIRSAVRSLYGVLRSLDDLVDDDHPEAEQRVEAVEQWAHGQETDTPEASTLAALAQRYPLPRGAVITFCQGMRHDIGRRTIETHCDFMRYCEQAGGSVGIMLAILLGSVDPRAETKMASLGRAMQWTNILRDIDEDLAHSRVYLPRSLVERFGFPTPGAREALMKDQIPRADALYDEGLEAIPLLVRGRRSMRLATILYREILREIERNGYGRKPGRVTVPAWRRRMLASRFGLLPTPHPPTRPPDQ